MTIKQPPLSLASIISQVLLPSSARLPEDFFHLGKGRGMIIGRWRRWRWRGGEAGQKRRIGEEKEVGGVDSVGRRLTWMTTWSNFF